MGEHLYSDDATILYTDVARLLVKTMKSKILDEVLDVKINGSFFKVKIIEDLQALYNCMILLNLIHLQAETVNGVKKMKV